MPTFQRVESLDAPELAPYRTMRRQTEHRRQGIFVAEGEKVVRRLLGSGWEILSALMEERWAAPLREQLEARREAFPVFLAPREALSMLAGYPLFQGVLAVGRVPPSPALPDLLARTPRPRLFVAVDGVSHAENMGAILRSGAAFGAQAILVGETSCSPWLRRAVRGSMGAVFRLPVFEASSLAETLDDLRSHGVFCVAAHPREGAEPVWQCDFRRDCCVVFGSEGFGLSDAVLARCAAVARIPMSPHVDSLNVAGAVAAFLYEVGRQRGMG
ncbi:MAG: RNA methyltransferase [Verrucomicrobiae bacterium]|nr:RNA methyltransferase [Verrucomicrobiae bacterium]